MHLVIRFIRTLSILLAIFVCATLAVAQEWNAARLTVLYGGNIPFYFNNLDKFKKGIEINTGTLLGVSMADSSQFGHVLEGFVLNFRSFNGQSDIKGDVYSIPLNRLQVKAESSLGLGSGISAGYLDLSASWSTLFSYTNVAWTDLDWVNNQISISYECGMPISEGGNGTLLGEEPDYYNVEIEFELVPTGPGF